MIIAMRPKSRMEAQKRMQGLKTAVKTIFNGEGKERRHLKRSLRKNKSNGVGVGF